MPRPRCVRRIASEIHACSILPFRGRCTACPRALRRDRTHCPQARRSRGTAARGSRRSLPRRSGSKYGNFTTNLRAHSGASPQKIADAILNGKALKIERAKAPCLERPPFAVETDRVTILPDDALLSQAETPTISNSNARSLQEKCMKIAFISDDGKTISRHFGRAMFYVVLTIEDGKIVQRDQRPKLGHGQFVGQHEERHVHDPGAAHGFEAGAGERHASMIDSIIDCKALIAGGMGAGAYASIREAGLEPS